MLERLHGGTSWGPSGQAASVVSHVTAPSSMSSLADIWLCPNEKPQTRTAHLSPPFLSSWPAQSWAKLNDYFKPLSLGMICYTAIVKGAICECNPEMTKSQTLCFPCIIISHLLFHTLRVCRSQLMMWPSSKSWKGNVGVWSLPLPKADSA